MPETSNDAVLIEHLPGRVGLVTLNRPEAINAFARASVRRFRAIVSALESDDSVDVIVLHARGERGFCAGVDLKERRGLSNEEAREIAADMLEMFHEFDRRAKPAIAAVFGHVLGGGFELALCCDMVVAAQDTTFALPEVKWGMIPAAAGCRKLAAQLGAVGAKEIILAGRSLAAADAERFGLVNSIAERAEVLPEALALAARVAAGVPQAVRAARRCIEDAIAAPAACDFDRRAALELYASADPARRLAGFGRTGAS